MPTTSTLPRTAPSAEVQGPDRPAAIARAGPFLFLPELVLALVTLLCVALLSAGGALRGISLTSAVMAVALTIRFGGRYLTPSGVFFLASGVFIGGAAYYLSIVDTPVSPPLLRDAAALALLTTIGISVVVKAFSIRWRISWPSTSPRRGPAGQWGPPPHFAVKGVLLLAVSFLPVTGSVLGQSSQAFGVAGLMMLVVWAAARWTRLRWYGDILIVGLVFALPMAWIQLTFTGGGRLLVAGTSIGAFAAWNLLNPSRLQKVLVILCIPLFLWAAGQSRVELGGTGKDTSASSVVSDGTGLGSVYSPLETFGQLIGPLTPDQREAFGPRYGGTFVNTLLLPIPRSAWEDKPKGFGAELTEVLEPELVSAQHSMAALTQGEWYANFGYGGLLLMVPVTGWVLALLDRKHARMARSGMDRPRFWWSAAVLACIVSSLGELYWVGTFTMFARGGLAAVIVAAAGFLSLSRQPPRGTSPVVDAPPRQAAQRRAEVSVDG